MKKTTLKLILIILLMVGLIGEFITTLIWWTKIKPWYSHGKGSVKSLYNLVYATWVVSLIIIIIMGVEFILLNKNESIDKVVNWTYITAFIPFITSAMCYSYSGESLSRYINGIAADIKCYDDLINSLEYIEAWAELHGKKSDYDKWYEKTKSKVIKYKSNGQIDHFTSYLCKTFGIPTLVFMILVGLCMLFYSYTSIDVPLFDIPKSENENSGINQNNEGSQNIENNQKIVGNE